MAEKLIPQSLSTESLPNLSEGFDQLSEDADSLLQTLENDYTRGELDIPEIARRLGESWTENDVALLFERRGVHRPISLAKLPSQNKANLLTKLAQLRALSQAEEFNNTERIQREVIASQRIESVYVSSEDLLNE